MNVQPSPAPATISGAASASVAAGPLTVLVTGAGSGIGEATALRLAAGGHRVFLGARRAGRTAALADRIAAAGGTAGHHPLDVTDRGSVRTFVDAALERYGRIDVLVNNAGVMPLSPMEALKVDEWERMIDVNLRGVLYGIAAVLPVMRAQSAGHVVNVASVSGLRVDPTAAVYSATKHAVRALSEGLRQESRHVRVTVVSPGYTHSELTDTISEADVREAVREASRIGMPASAVAEAIAYAVTQPPEVDVNEVVVRPIAQG